jgi:hypothetical protein
MGKFFQLFYLITIASATLWAPIQGASTAIRGAAVWDSIREVFIPDRTILIEADRIKTIAAASTAVPNGATLIDARGKYLIPGLIDAHVHVVHVLDFAQITGEEVMPLYLAYGVTSLRDTGDFVAAEKLISRYVDAHPETCPRLFMCSPLIDGDPPFHRDIGFALTDPAKGREHSQALRGDGTGCRPCCNQRRTSGWVASHRTPGKVCCPGRGGGRHRLPRAHLVGVQLQLPSRVAGRGYR